MRKSRWTLLVLVAALSGGLSATAAAASQANGQTHTATATLTQSGCDLTLTYTWSKFRAASTYTVAIQQQISGGYNAVISRGFTAARSGSETITYTIPSGTTGTFRGQAWLDRSDGSQIARSVATTAGQAFSCP